MHSNLHRQSLPDSDRQAFLFHKKNKQTKAPPFTPIVDHTGQGFIPQKRLHGTVPPKLHIPLQRIAARIYENREILHEEHPIHASWEKLHALGVIALGDSSPEDMLRVLYHYAAITQRPFFDFSKWQHHAHKKNYRVTTGDKTSYTISDVFLTLLTTPQSITFFRRTTDVSYDERHLLEHILFHHDEYLMLNDSIVPIITHPVFFRYIHITIQPDDNRETQETNTILYFS